MNALSSLPYFALDTSSGLHTPTSWFLFCFLNWTVSINLIDPPCKDGNARFTTIPLNTRSDQKCFILVLLTQKDEQSDNFSIVSVTQ